MRYVIVSKVNGEAGDFNNNLRRELYNKLKAKSSKLPAHFTIKAPFKYDGDITELVDAIKRICSNNKVSSYKIDGYDHFDNRVIYMKVIMSKEGKALHDEIIDELSKFSYIDFSNSDGKDKIFHVTLASKRIGKMYNDIWKFIHIHPCNFTCNFDNICIYKWEENTWKFHKEIKIG